MKKMICKQAKKMMPRNAMHCRLHFEPFGLSPLINKITIENKYRIMMMKLKCTPHKKEEEKT
jgi:hypothetical protein